MQRVNNILVVRLSSLGDVLMCIPAVKAIRDLYPDAHISWLAEGSVAEFLASQEFIDEVIRFPRAAVSRGLSRGRMIKAHRAFAPCRQQLKTRKYDLIVDFHGIAKSVLLSMVARGKRKIGFGSTFAKEKSHFFYHDKIESKDKRIHKVERNMLIAAHLGHRGPAPQAGLKVSAEAGAYIDEYLAQLNHPSPLFAVNPFSSAGTDFKRWPLERYAELARRIKDELGGRTIVLWGPGEEKEAAHLVEMAGDGTTMACPTTIPQLFALLQRTNLYIGGDTGVMHLAAGAGVPVVAIFGPTDVKINGPYGKGHLVIRQELSCSPCKKKDCRERQCIVNISAEEVFQAVSSIYHARNRSN